MIKITEYNSVEISSLSFKDQGLKRQKRSDIEYGDIYIMILQKGKKWDQNYRT